MDTTNILTPSERRAAAEAKMQTATVGEKLQREFGVAPAQAGELTPEIRSAIESQKASQSQITTPVSPTTPTTPVSAPVSSTTASAKSEPSTTASAKSEPVKHSETTAKAESTPPYLS